MDKLLGLAISISAKEEDQIYNDLLSQDSIDDSDDTLMRLSKCELIKEEMINYMTSVLMAAYNLSDKVDAMLMWEDYKEKHNIVIREG